MPRQDASYQMSKHFPSGATRVSPATVAVVDAGPKVLGTLVGDFEVGRYALVFLESWPRGHSDIKRLNPQLVIVCARMENPDSCQLLTMLKLDDATRHIPVFTVLEEEDAGSSATESISDASAWSY